MIPPPTINKPLRKLCFKFNWRWLTSSCSGSVDRWVIGSGTSPDKETCLHCKAMHRSPQVWGLYKELSTFINMRVCIQHPYFLTPYHTYATTNVNRWFNISFQNLNESWYVCIRQPTHKASTSSKRLVKLPSKLWSCLVSSILVKKHVLQM